MRKASSVRIGGKRIKLTYDDKMEAEGLAGEFSGETIRLNPRQSKAALESTVFHELIHAALSIGGVNEILSERQEEAVAHCLENLLAPLYRRK